MAPDISPQHEASGGGDAASGHFSARVAAYGDPAEPPRLSTVAAADEAGLLEALADAVILVVAQAGGAIPLQALREVLDNLIHAGCEGAVVTVLDEGNTVRVSDRGPGVADKARAVLPGYTTAGRAERAVVRGVGAGLAVAEAALAREGGTLDIQDNLGGGTVVTLQVPPRVLRPSLHAEAVATEPLTDRQLRALLLVVEHGSAGPARIARELTVATSTACRDFRVLEDRGFVVSDDRGRRSATEDGLLFLQAVL